MAKRKRKLKNKFQKQISLQKVQHLADAIKEELRSIIRQWDKLRKPLRCSEKVSNLSEGSPCYRIEGAQSPEELEDLILRFAGSVWHLKDRLKLWVEAKGLKLREMAANGVQIETSIEKTVEKSLNLLLCADLDNMKKHGEVNCSRTPYSPVLNGVSFDTSKFGVIGINYDGRASHMGDILATNPEPVPYRVEILSGDGKMCFGDAVVVITRGFGYWIPLIRQLGILKDEQESEWIAENLGRVKEYIKQTNPFKLGETVTDKEKGLKELDKNAE